VFRNKAKWIIAGIVIAIPVVAVGWWLASPLFLNATVDESFPLSSGATVPEGMTRAEVEQAMSAMAKVKQETDEDMPAGADASAQVKSGSFRDADSFHKGSGRATIYRLPDGSHVLRLEDFQVTNGPDLHVYLSAHPNPASSEEIKQGSYVDLGSLKGNIGNQNYVIPADVDVSAMQSVIIYCQPFHVIFSVASLQ